MYLNVSYDKKFDDLMMYLKSKYPEKLFDLEGIGDQTDLSLFSKKFFSTKTTIADTSVDANANVDDMSIIAYENELPKPFFRLNSLYLTWRYLKQLYNIKTANKAVEMQITGDIYINDFTGINKPYCYNFSTYDVMLKGLPFVKKVKSEPPKHLSSFIGQIIHFSVYASNSVLGAVGLADILIVASYYVKKLFEDNPDVPHNYLWKQVKQEFQSFVYSCNQPFRGGMQSGFYNISIFDDNFLDKMCSEYIFPDGSSPDKDIVKEIQLMYLDLMNETLRNTPITFPVTTACFSVDENKEILDKNFLKMIAEKNKEFGFINIYCGETSTLSSCCFDGKQKTLTRNSVDGVKYVTFDELYNGSYNEYKKDLFVFHNGSWSSGKLIKIPKDNKKLYKITTINNKEIIVTEDHKNPTYNGDILAEDLTTEDYLLFNNLPLDSFPEKNENMTYEQGVFIGAYLGDGSIYENTINFSLNEDKYNKLINILEKSLKDWGIDSEIKLNNQYNNVYPTTIINADLVGIIRQWVDGKYSHEKELDLNCLLQNKEFRQGIIDGYYITDGGNSNRIYSTSLKLIEQIEVVMTSLGLISTIDISDRTTKSTGEKVVIRGKEFNRNYPLYCIRWYEPKNKRTMKDVYKIKNNSIYFKVKSIEEYESNDEYVYCFEMKNEEEQYFTLPNGIITHNCRLRSNIINEYFNQFGAGGTKIGSLGVVTINIPRIAIKSNGDKEEFMKLLQDYTDMAIKINNTKRHLLKKRIEGNSLPLYSLEFMDLKTQYSTTGVVGLSEACDIMGTSILEEDGQCLVEEILNTINKLSDRASKRYNAPHNMEQVPAENSSIKLAQKDKLLGYQNKYELYSNQFIPLTVNADLLDRIKLQGLFDSKMSGGAIAHLNVEQKIEDTALIENLIKYSAKAGVVYIAINYNLQRCVNEHMTVGKGDICSICGEGITDNYTRVVGFLVNTKNFHQVRREIDYPNRVFYKEI